MAVSFALNAKEQVPTSREISWIVLQRFLQIQIAIFTFISVSLDKYTYVSKLETEKCEH